MIYFLQNTYYGSKKKLWKYKRRNEREIRIKKIYNRKDCSFKT
jgi:hypothetical protein